MTHKTEIDAAFAKAPSSWMRNADREVRTVLSAILCFALELQAK